MRFYRDHVVYSDNPRVDFWVRVVLAAIVLPLAVAFTVMISGCLVDLGCSSQACVAHASLARWAEYDHKVANVHLQSDEKPVSPGTVVGAVALGGLAAGAGGAAIGGLSAVLEQWISDGQEPLQRTRSEFEGLRDLEEPEEPPLGDQGSADGRICTSTVCRLPGIPTELLKDL